MPISRSLVIFLALAASDSAFGQQLAPAMGYMHPAGVAAGQTVEVTLGGDDWTPDMQLFVLDPRMKLELAGPPGPVVIPDPPYWFGKKARRGPDPIPREFKARLTVPKDVPAGIYSWQAANANGVSKIGKFVVTHGKEVVEVEGREAPQTLETLPVTVSGQIKVVEEVDRFRFKATATGPVTCVLTARLFGSAVNAVLEVHDSKGRFVADAADTAGNDTALTFAAAAGEEYTASVYDLDFRGDRAYTYRLGISQAPRVVTAVPAAGKRGETKSVEFVGYGVATGAPKLESVRKDVAFPNDPNADSFSYRLETTFGVAPPMTLLLSQTTETVEPAGNDLNARRLAVPSAVTGVLDEVFGEDRYLVTAKKGDSLQLSAITETIGSPLDVSIAIFNAEEKELIRSDDLPGSVDAGLTFVAPADGDFEVRVADVSGRSGDRSGTYRLTIAATEPGFTISAPDLLAVPIGGTAKLALKVVRTGGFKDPITVRVSGLPEGVTVPENLAVAAGQAALAIELTAAETVASLASLATITAEAKVGESMVKQVAGPVLVASTMKIPFSIEAEGRDDVTKWPRGTTFPGPVLIEREAGFNGEIVLEMHSKQGRVIQGIWGPELTVAPNESRVLYPIFLPEWLETTRTSRMVVNGVAKIPDAKGNVRYVSSKLKTRIGFLPGGALMKLAADKSEFTVAPGGSLSIPLTISRTVDLKEPAKVELMANGRKASFFTSQPETWSADKTQAVFPIAVRADAAPDEEHELTIRATVLQDGKYPVISEATVLVILKPTP